jgi:GNAT superfamily N-acetyltransferase
VSSRLERLEPRHPVESFTCGHRAGAADIDDFLRTRALTEQSQGLSSTTVAVESNQNGIVGFFTLSPLSVSIDPEVRAALGLTDARYARVGGYLLGPLGVTVSQQGHGFGELLIERAIDAARRAQHAVGGAFLAVDAKNDRLLAWYLRLGFGFERLHATGRRVVVRIG